VAHGPDAWAAVKAQLAEAQDKLRRARADVKRVQGGPGEGRGGRTTSLSAHPTHPPTLPTPHIFPTHPPYTTPRATPHILYMGGVNYHTVDYTVVWRKSDDVMFIAATRLAPYLPGRPMTSSSSVRRPRRQRRRWPRRNLRRRRRAPHSHARRRTRQISSAGWRWRRRTSSACRRAPSSVRGAKGYSLVFTTLRWGAAFETWALEHHL